MLLFLALGMERVEGPLQGVTLGLLLRVVPTFELQSTFLQGGDAGDYIGECHGGF